MRRVVRAGVTAAVFFAVWTLLLFHSTLLPELKLSPTFDRIVPTTFGSFQSLARHQPFCRAAGLGSYRILIPLWLLVTFGSYSLANIGWALVTFGDCPDAQISLLKEIQTAKMDLRSRGVSID
eukprot:jgi/Hompol1/4652/HPOL_003805-RA